MTPEQHQTLYNAALIISTAFIAAVANWIQNRQRDKKAQKATEAEEAEKAAEFNQAFKRDTKIDKEIVDEMEAYIGLTGADRVLAFVYHNGDYYVTKRAMRKMSCVYEATKKGVERIQPDMQNTPLSFMPNFFDKILRDKEYEVKNLDDVRDCKPATWQIKTGQGIKSFYDLGLEDENGNNIGLLAFQWVNSYGSLTADEKQQAKQLKWFIESRISKKNEVKK